MQLHVSVNAIRAYNVKAYIIRVWSDIGGPRWPEAQNKTLRGARRVNSIETEQSETLRIVTQKRLSFNVFIFAKVRLIMRIIMIALFQ